MLCKCKFNCLCLFHSGLNPCVLFVLDSYHAVFKFSLICRRYPLSDFGKASFLFFLKLNLFSRIIIVKSTALIFQSHVFSCDIFNHFLCFFDYAELFSLPIFKIAQTVFVTGMMNFVDNISGFLLALNSFLVQLRLNAFKLCSLLHRQAAKP